MWRKWVDETREAPEVAHSAAKAESGERETSESFDFEIRVCCRLHLTTSLLSSSTFSATLITLHPPDCDRNYLLQKSRDQNPTTSAVGERREITREKTQAKKMDRLSRMLQAAQGMGMGGQGGGAAQVRHD
jgi:hypothetical protein